jgi:receptor protein-tyrosine kinase
LHRVKLDFEFLRRGGVLVPSQARSDLAQQFRRVKSPLLRNARTATAAGSPPGQLIMVTSALSGEGKTFFSINLAMSMAMEVDTSVLLVDADVVRPGLFARLGIDTGAPGLLDLLTQPALRLAQAVIATNLPKLALLAAGAPHERSTELLGSVAMERLLSQLVHDYPDHIIIFDAPPLLTTTEAAILAPMVGQIVVVVEAQRTPRRSVEQAFAALGGCPVVLSVLNKSETKDDSRSYGLATE